MIIPIRRARVKILPFASSVAYPFLIASPDTNVPIALNTQKTGMVTIFIIIGPIIGIAAIKTSVVDFEEPYNFGTNEYESIIQGENIKSFEGQPVSSCIKGIKHFLNK